MKEGPKVLTVFVTAPDREVALSLARQVVEERLAACANVMPNVTSVFRWEDSMREEPEVLLIFKTGAERVEALIERISDLHPYDVPEVLALPVEAGHGPYLEWVRDSTGTES